MAEQNFPEDLDRALRVAAGYWSKADGEQRGAIFVHVQALLDELAGGGTPDPDPDPDPGGEPGEIIVGREFTTRGITLTFSEDVEAARFVGSGGWAFKIPCPRPQVSGSTGAMWSPRPAIAQAYIAPAANYSATQRIEHQAELDALQRMPETIETVGTLICADALPQPSQRVELRAAAMFSFVEELPSADEFRPSYTQRVERQRYRSDGLRERVNELPRLEVYGGPTAAELLEQIDGPWIDHCPTFIGSVLHPVENGPTYGRDIAFWGYAALAFLVCDRPEAEKYEVALRVCQLGVDIMGIAESPGFDDDHWLIGGGHATGRRGLVSATIHLLGLDPTWLASRPSVQFNESHQIRYVDDELVQRGYGYGSSDLGKPEWATKWWRQLRQNGGAGDMDAWHDWLADTKGASYRFVVGCVLWGAAAFHEATDTKDLFASDAFFDYVARYRKECGDLVDRGLREPWALRWNDDFAMRAWEAAT